MKEKHITRVSSADLARMKDRTRSDAPANASLDRDFWAKAKIVYPQTAKKQLTMRLDSDMVDWFKRQGKGYQTRMNAVLRSYFESQTRGPR